MHVFCFFQSGNSSLDHMQYVIADYFQAEFEHYNTFTCYMKHLYEDKDLGSHRMIRIFVTYMHIQAV